MNDTFRPSTIPATVEIFKKLLFIRLVEESIAENYSDHEMRCPVHLSIGQEAVAVGVCEALRKSDPVFSTHRCHAHYLAKGGDLQRMVAEIYGKAAGCCGGRGGSMHLTDPDVGMIVSVPIVASCIPLAVGSALCSKLDHTQDVSVAFLGDGSLEEGVFHESANFASLNKLPVIFVCENNQYSVYTNLSARQPPRPIKALADAHGMKCFSADGNDVEAVHEKMLQAVQMVRSGNGPVFLIFDTYRSREHCGPNFDNHLEYRDASEIAVWDKNDPLVRLKIKLFDQGWLTENSVSSMTTELQSEISAAIQFAKSAPLPHPDQITNHVYATMNKL